MGGDARVSALGQRLVIHERIGVWARQLRPRLVDRPVLVVETRNGSDLDEALRGSRNVFPIVLIDVGPKLLAAIEDLDRVRGLAPEALILMLDSAPHAGLSAIARELGAARVLSGPIPPPFVADLLGRWLCLARRRAEESGWQGPPARATEPEPWNWLAPWLNPPP